MKNYKKNFLWVDGMSIVDRMVRIIPLQAVVIKKNIFLIRMLEFFLAVKKRD